MMLLSIKISRMLSPPIIRIVYIYALQLVDFKFSPSILLYNNMIFIYFLVFGHLFFIYIYIFILKKIVVHSEFGDLVFFQSYSDLKFSNFTLIG